MNDLEVTWLGHATVLLHLAGLRVLTDPVLRPRVGPLVRHGAPPAAPAVDVVLLSHRHRDHLDVPTLARILDGRVRVVGPRGTRAALRRLSRRAAVDEVTVGDRIELSSTVTASATPARHDGRRNPLARDRGEALGFVLDGGGRAVYFAGDTGLFAGMRRIGDVGLDVALLPVGGWGPRLGGDHLDPEDAARAAGLLRPAVAVPIHWGTYLRAGLRRPTDAERDAPARAFARAAATAAPEVAVVVLAPGETWRRAATGQGPAGVATSR